jgi:hypothetical protein
MYDHEYVEWRRDVQAMTEMQRVATEYEVRSSAGMSGDREDARYEH